MRYWMKVIWGAFKGGISAGFTYELFAYVGYQALFSLPWVIKVKYLALRVFLLMLWFEHMEYEDDRW
jgi:hypothetical protein